MVRSINIQWLIFTSRIWKLIVGSGDIDIHECSRTRNIQIWNRIRICSNLRIWIYISFKGPRSLSYMYTDSLVSFNHIWLITLIRIFEKSISKLLYPVVLLHSTSYFGSRPRTRSRYNSTVLCGAESEYIKTDPDLDPLRFWPVCIPNCEKLDCMLHRLLFTCLSPLTPTKPTSNIYYEGIVQTCPVYGVNLWSMLT